jgi:glycine C-acetyltransferase
VIYPHADLAALERALVETDRSLRKLIVTDGVFSMEGDIAPLPGIVALARENDAAVMVDDSHATGVLGTFGRGIAEHFGLLGEIDVITSTLGKALGGSAGGYVASSAEIIDLLAQRSRPQLFSNALPPSVACTARRALELLLERPGLVQRLHDNVRFFREGLQAIGFEPLPGDAAIIPILVGETSFAIELSERLLDRGVFVTGFGFPVVPEGRARVRVQMSAAHEREHLEQALEAFEAVGHDVGLLATPA